MTNVQINQLFTNLDAWRHLPAYQLERRADIFFSLYLAEVLQKKFSLSETPILIPEFPVRYGTVRDSLIKKELFGKAGQNQSFKIDYLAVTKDGKRVFFVELKTDMDSKKSTQNENMTEAAKVLTSTLFKGIECLLQKSNQKRKYRSLYGYIAALLDLEIRPDGIVAEDAFDKFATKPKIVYLQPAKSDNNEDIDFKEFAEFINAKHKDDLSQRFVNSLQNWQTKAESK